MDILISNSTVKMLAPAVEDLLLEDSCQSIENELLSMHSELRRPLLRYAVSFGLPIQDGEDVIQETFLALFQHLQRGRSRRNLRSWVFRVTHNLARKRHRLTKNKIQMEVEEERLNSACDLTPGPEDQVLFRERRQRLTRVMQALSQKDQACLRLRAEGLRYREIAEILEISLGSVSSSLARSVERLTRTDER